MLLKQSFFFKIVLFNIARRTQNLFILRCELKQNVIFCLQFFFKIALFKNKFLFEIWRVVNLLIQKLTRFKKFDSKSAFQIIFSDSGWIIINVLPTCWKMTTAGFRIIFYECVVCVCLTFGTIFLLIAFLWQLGFWWVWWPYHLRYQLN